MLQQNPQQHLAALQNRWLLHDPGAAAITANALEDIIHSIFGDPARIGYELLQNADDAAKEEGLSVDVEYILLHRHLIVQHNGRFFSALDVESLCRYGSVKPSEPGREELAGKQYNLKKIGYKGIGFKSVFNLAERVWICSEPYTFKFDKAHWQGRQLPWQIIPIACGPEELPEEVRRRQRKGWVSFVLELKPEEPAEKFRETKKAIATLFNKEEVILFLRHVRSVRMVLQDKEGTQLVGYRQLERAKDGNVYRLKKWVKDELEAESRWHISSFEFPVPEEVSATLRPLDKRKCPEKLKAAAETEISFAARLREDNTIIPLSRPFLFSYLPTEARYEFPFLANGNFLLNEARTELLNERWNEFLFEQIGYHQLPWFRQMAGDERFKYEFAGLLVKYADSNRERRNQSLNRGVQRASEEVAFVPVLSGKALKKAPETVVDQTGLSTGLQDQQLVKESFEKELSIADPNIKQIDRLIRIGAEQFGREKLRDAIRQSKRYRDPEGNARLIGFFFNHINQLPHPGERDAWMEVLRETPFLLDQEEALACPPELYFPGQAAEIPFRLPLRFLHSAVYQHHVKGQAGLEEWLHSLGLAYPRPLELIRREVVRLLREDKINAANTLAIGRFLFQHWRQLEEQDFQQLGIFPVLTTQGQVRKVSSSYLSDAYQPMLPLEHILQEDIFIAPDYQQEDSTPAAWNRFWARLGARQDMDIELHPTWGPLAQLKREYPEYHDFLKPFLPAFNARARHDIVNFVLPRYIEYCSNYNFALQYWEVILKEKWQEVREKCNKCYFQHSNGRSLIPSYFEFLARSRAFFPAEDEKCYPAEALYSQALKPLVGSYRPVAAIAMSWEQENLFGIRNELSLDNCIALLKSIAQAEGLPDKEQISRIYEYIIARRFSPDMFEARPDVFQGLLLLANNNTFRPVDTLYCLAIPEFAVKADAADSIFLNLPEEKAHKLCLLLGVHIISLEGLSLSASPQEEPDGFLRHWEERLPLISTFLASRKGGSPAAEQQRLALLTRDLDIRAAQQLALELLRDGRRIYHKSVRAWRKDNTIWFVHPWYGPQARFDLMSVLAQYFEVENYARELDLLLSLPTAEGVEWLTEQGIEIGLEKKHSRKAASPVKVAVEKALPPQQPIPVHEPKSGYAPIRKTDAQQVGRWGEQWAHDKEVIRRYYQEQQLPLRELIWLNQAEESGQPYDFEARLEDGSMEYWEVKSTPSPRKNEFPISEYELQFALQNRERYRLLHVQQAGGRAPKASVFSDPVGSMEAGQLLVCGAVVRVVGQDG